MELARHSDMRLTMKTYTDAGQLPLREVMDSLPGFGSDSRIDSRNLGPTGQTVSQPVTEMKEMKNENTIANKGEIHDLTAAVPVCHSEPENGGFEIRIPLSPPFSPSSARSLPSWWSSHESPAGRFVGIETRAGGGCGAAAPAVALIHQNRNNGIEHFCAPSP